MLTLNNITSHYLLFFDCIIHIYVSHTVYFMLCIYKLKQKIVKWSRQSSKTEKILWLLPFYDSTWEKCTLYSKLTLTIFMTFFKLKFSLCVFQFKIRVKGTIKMDFSVVLCPGESVMLLCNLKSMQKIERLADSLQIIVFR